MCTFETTKLHTFGEKASLAKRISKRSKEKSWINAKTPRKSEEVNTSCERDEEKKKVIG